MKASINDTLYTISPYEGIMDSGTALGFYILPDEGFDYSTTETDLLATSTIYVTDEDGNIEQTYDGYDTLKEFKKLYEFPLEYDDQMNVTETGEAYYVEYRPAEEADKLDVIAANTDYLVMMMEG